MLFRSSPRLHRAPARKQDCQDDAARAVWITRRGAVWAGRRRSGNARIGARRLGRYAIRPLSQIGTNVASSTLWLPAGHPSGRSKSRSIVHEPQKHLQLHHRNGSRRSGREHSKKSRDAEQCASQSGPSWSFADLKIRRHCVRIMAASVGHPCGRG